MAYYGNERHSFCAWCGICIHEHIQVSCHIIKLYSYTKARKRITAQYVSLCARFGRSWRTISKFGISCARFGTRLPAHVHVSCHIIKFNSYTKARKRTTAQYVILCARFGRSWRIISKFGILCARFSTRLLSHILVSCHVITIYSYTKARRRITAQYIILCARFGSRWRIMAKMTFFVRPLR